METRTSELLSQSQATAGGKERAGGGGGSGEPRLSGKEEREGRVEARVPRPSLRTPFPDRAASSNRRARARQPGTRSPGPPLKRPLLGSRLLVPVRAALPPRARACPPPGSPRAASRDRAQPRRQQRRRELRRRRRRQWQREQLRRQRGAGGVWVWKEGSARPERVSVRLPRQSCGPPDANGAPDPKLCASPSCSAVRSRVAAAPPGADRAAVLTKGAAPRPPLLLRTAA